MTDAGKLTTPSDTLSKVPAVTLGFWVIKILATTLGETGGDTVSMTKDARPVGREQATVSEAGFQFWADAWSCLLSETLLPRSARSGNRPRSENATFR